MNFIKVMICLNFATRVSRAIRGRDQLQDDLYDSFERDFSPKFLTDHRNLIVHVKYRDTYHKITFYLFKTML